MLEGEKKIKFNKKNQQKDSARDLENQNSSVLSLFMCKKVES